MPPAPTLTGRDLGQAERATRAVLERLLAEHGVTFLQSVALNLLADAGSVLLERDGLVRQMTGSLKIDETPVLAAVDELVRLGLVTGGPGPECLELTPPAAGGSGTCATASTASPSGSTGACLKTTWPPPTGCWPSSPNGPTPSSRLERCASHSRGTRCWSRAPGFA
jgi:hypothetical protein